jgi:hypothetical protein
MASRPVSKPGDLLALQFQAEKGASQKLVKHVPALSTKTRDQIRSGPAGRAGKRYDN